MRKQNLLTREQAIELVGKEAVQALDTIEIDYSNRSMSTDEIEFTSHHNLPEQKNFVDGITAYYYQSKQAHDEIIKNGDELSDLDWSDVAGYEIY